MLKAFEKSPAILAATDDRDWFERSEYWRNYRPSTRGAPKKFKFREPLILCGHGVRIRVDHNTLLIRNGFTHYPQKSEEIRFFPGEANLPDRIVILDGDGGITFDALNWMSIQKITLVQLDWQGEISAVADRAGYCANPRLAEAQRAAKAGSLGPTIARWLISEKIKASISVLGNEFPKSDIREIAIARHEKRLSELRNSRKSISQLLGIEGDCAQMYFKTWHGVPIKWSEIKRKPIPGNWFKIAPRTMTWRKGANFARHPVNSMLNYGYGILAHHLQADVIAAGLDPTIGIIHGNKQNPVPLVYDLMEPLRPVVDQTVLEFARSHIFTPGDFTINSRGGCRLNPQMARVVASAMTGIKSDKVVTGFLKHLH